MEIETLLDKCNGHPVVDYLLSKDEELNVVDDIDPAKAKSTLFGQMRVYIRSRRGLGLTGKTTGIFEDPSQKEQPYRGNYPRNG